MQADSHEMSRLVFSEKKKKKKKMSSAAVVIGTLRVNIFNFLNFFSNSDQIDINVHDLSRSFISDVC